MKLKIKYQILIMIVVLLLVETISYFIMRSMRAQEVGFIVNLNYHNEITHNKGFGFDELDPLCGWSQSNESLRAMGYEVSENCEVLRSKGEKPDKPIKILITGGSTSDIALHKENWPLELQKLFIENKVNAIIYVGAVGGYTSSQELLKLVRDGSRLNPDIHISYTGANDGEDNGYVTSYEQTLYKTAYRESYTNPILPCTIFLLKKAFNLSYYDMSIKRVLPLSGFEAWKQNMNIMSAIAQKNSKKFVGILEPVLGEGNYHQSNAKEIDPSGSSAIYQSYYPQAIKHIYQDSSIYDFTGIFDTVHGVVYTDDSHIAQPYQILVAENIYKLLSAKGYIPVR